MTWLHRYHLRSYLAGSMWILPLASMIGALASVRVLDEIEPGAPLSAVDPGSAQAVLGTMAASMFTLIVFVSSALLVAVQLASSQLTRISASARPHAAASRRRSSRAPSRAFGAEPAGRRRRRPSRRRRR